MITLEDVLILARTIYGEARGEPLDGQIAVGHTLLNRLKARHRKESTLVGVCTEPYQFSAWNENDPNRDKIQAVTVDDRAFRGCMVAALQALNIPDTVDGSTHYHTKEIHPPWAEGHEPVTVIGNHLFYAGIP